MKTTRRSFIQACLAAAVVAVDLVYARPNKARIVFDDLPIAGTKGYPVAAGEIIMPGDLVAYNGSGQIVRWSGKATAIGVWSETVNDTVWLGW